MIREVGQIHSDSSDGGQGSGTVCCLLAVAAVFVRGSCILGS